MKSMLILTDFSEPAFRAAEYACGLTGLLQIRRIILYHAYQTFIATTDLPVSPVKNNQEVYMESMEALGLLHDRIKPMVEHTVQIDLFATDAFLPELINQRCREEEVDIIVMGVSGTSGFEKLLLGSTTSRILERSEFPVLIVPNEALIGREIKSIVLTTDLKNIPGIPVDQLYTFLDAFKADLNVVHVEPIAEEKYPPETREAITGLHHLLDKYHPDFHYINAEDIVETVLAFAGNQHASLIITVPKTHSFLSAIFHKSISRNLAYNSRIPLLSLPAIR